MKYLIDAAVKVAEARAAMAKEEKEGDGYQQVSFSTEQRVDAAEDAFRMLFRKEVREIVDDVLMDRGVLPYDED